MNEIQQNFTRLVFNATGMVCVVEFAFHPTRKWRFDYAIPAAMVAIEVEGGAYTNGRHTRGKGFEADLEKYNTAESMGWHVLRVTPEWLCAPKTIEMIRTATAIAMGEMERLTHVTIDPKEIEMAIQRIPEDIERRLK